MISKATIQILHGFCRFIQVRIVIGKVIVVLVMAVILMVPITVVLIFIIIFNNDCISDTKDIIIMIINIINVYRFIYQSVYLSIGLLINISTLSIYLSVCLSACPSICPEQDVKLHPIPDCLFG